MLLKRFLRAVKIKIILAYANDNFKVASCNDASGRPELTIQIADSYYTNNLSGQEGFALADGYYSKAIAEDDLDFTFSDDADGTSLIIFLMKFQEWFFLEIILSYTLDTSSSATDFSLTDTVSIRFVKIYV